MFEIVGSREGNEFIRSFPFSVRKTFILSVFESLGSPYLLGEDLLEVLPAKKGARENIRETQLRFLGSYRVDQVVIGISSVRSERR